MTGDVEYFTGNDYFALVLAVMMALFGSAILLFYFIVFPDRGSVSIWSTRLLWNISRRKNGSTRRIVDGIITDMFEYCTREMVQWNPISVSGYHIREAGSTAVQELAFTLADGFAYVEAGIEKGLLVDDFAPRLSFFFNSHLDFFEEIAKFRAAGEFMPSGCGTNTEPKIRGHGC